MTPGASLEAAVARYDAARLRESVQHASRQRRYYHANRDAGLCPCGRPRDARGIKCSRCLNNVRSWRARNVGVR